MLGSDIAGALWIYCASIKGLLNDDCTPALIHHHNANQACPHGKRQRQATSLEKPHLRQKSHLGSIPRVLWLDLGILSCLGF